MKNVLAEGIKDNWHLLLLCVGLLAGSVIWATSKSDEASDGGAAAVSAATVETRDFVEGAAPVTQSRWSREGRTERMENSAADYERQLAQGTNKEERPADLYRLANIYYSNLQEYEKAATYYEALLKEAPDYRGIQTVYPNLATCYERLGKKDLEKHTYRRMLTYYPKDTQEYLYAQTMLGN